MGKGMSGAIAEAPQTIGQQAASTMQNMGLGERLLYAVPHSLKNVAVVGTTGVLAGMGASSAARSIATVAPLSSPNTVSRGIGRSMQRDSSSPRSTRHPQHFRKQTSLLELIVFNAATAQRRCGLPDFQAPALNRWYTQQSQIAPAQFLSQARQNHIINVQQYQGLGEEPPRAGRIRRNLQGAAQHDIRRDSIGNLTKESLGRTANLKAALERAQTGGLKSTIGKNQPELADV